MRISGREAWEAVWGGSNWEDAEVPVNNNVNSSLDWDRIIEEGVELAKSLGDRFAD